MLLASDMAKAAGVSYLVNDAAEQRYKRARESTSNEALKDLDFSAVFEQVVEEGSAAAKKSKGEE